MKKIIVLGSLNMDLSIQSTRMPLAGETIQGSDFLASPGGKGANQAVAAGKLGASVHMVGAVGHDVFGTALIDSLHNVGIHTDYVLVRTDTSTGIAVILLSQGDNRIILNGGANQTIDIKEASHIIRQLASPGDILICQFEIPLPTVIESLKLAKSLGVYTVLNPAPAMTFTDPSFLTYVDYLVLNESEAETMSNLVCTPESYELIAKYFQQLGVKHIILTLGKNGSITFSDGKTYTQSALPIQVVDTTGAGDAFIGGFVYGLTKGQSLPESIHLATKVATLAVSKRGAQQAMPTLEEVKTFYK